MTLSPDIHPFEKKLGDTSPDEIVDIIRRAGISGMGGATFPTWAKLSGAIGKVKRLIINCAECEPFITVNHRLMLEHPEEVVGGAKILLRALGLPSGEIAIEDNKLNAADKIAAEIGDSPLLEVKLMRTKYPQGDERQLYGLILAHDDAADVLLQGVYNGANLVLLHGCFLSKTDLHP